MGGDDDTIKQTVRKRDTDTESKRKQFAAGGVIVAVATAAWFAFGKQVLSQRRFKKMETFILKADNGTAAHIRPLGCCIQSTDVHAD